MAALTDFRQVALYELDKEFCTWITPWALSDTKVVELNKAHGRYDEVCYHLNELNESCYMDYVSNTPIDVLPILEFLLDEYRMYLEDIHNVDKYADIVYPKAYGNEELTLNDEISIVLSHRLYLIDEDKEFHDDIEYLYDSYEQTSMKVNVVEKVTYVTHVEYKGITFTVDRLNRVTPIKVPYNFRKPLADMYPSKSLEEINALRGAIDAFIEDARLAVKAKNLYVEVE